MTRIHQSPPKSVGEGEFCKSTNFKTPFKNAKTLHQLLISKKMKARHTHSESQSLTSSEFNYFFHQTQTHGS